MKKVSFSTNFQKTRFKLVGLLKYCWQIFQINLQDLYVNMQSNHGRVLREMN